MSYNGGAHRYLLPSRLRVKSSGPPGDSWTLEGSLTESLPPLKGLVYLLGKQYNLPQDGTAFVEDLQSRLWFTYRKNFRPIGDTGYTSDSGWGCTLRCGQMLLGHALILRHLGREWRWNPDGCCDQRYQKILRMFLDLRDSEYSIQMIALQGADFGRSVGQWFGPNNVAQAIKRLAVHDEWSQVAVYVAMDMLVIIDDIKALARQPHGIKGSVEVTTMDGDRVPIPVKTDGRLASSDPALNEDFEILTKPNISDDDAVKSAEITRRWLGRRHYSRSYDPSFDKSLLNLTMEDLHKQGKADSGHLDERSTGHEEATPSGFRPVLIFIPLRLGQERFNMEYKEAVKACFTVTQSVGIIGGKPRHALWFVGYHDDYLIHLDPHKTQSCVSVTDSGHISDSTYHTTQIERLHISELDPSLALGFYCQTERDLDELCDKLKSDVLSKMKYLFELTKHRPAYWGPPESAKHMSKEPFILLQVEKNSDESSEGFELVDWPCPESEAASTDPAAMPPR